MPKGRGAVALGDLVPGILQNLSQGSRPSRDAMEEIWMRLVGKGAAQHSWPRSLTQKRLLVEVENSGWMYTLRTRQLELLRGLIELMGAGRVNALSFRIGERKNA